MLFADCRNVETLGIASGRLELRHRSLTGATVWRFAAFPTWHTRGSRNDVQYLKDVVVALMIEKKSAVDDLEAILEVDGN